jgi:L-threonylcarbamoyladenylate synthase
MQNIFDDENLINTIKEGGVVVMPTDTIYGILTNALNKENVERLYKIRKRSPEKPCIILISEISEIENFGISLSVEERKNLLDFFALEKPTSVILDCNNQEFSHLHRGTNSLSFRLPKREDLRNLIKQTGPLIAPSANTEGNIPAKNITEAKAYFGAEVDMYIDGGEIIGNASSVIRLYKDGTTSIIRA